MSYSRPHTLEVVRNKKEAHEWLEDLRQRIKLQTGRDLDYKAIHQVAEQILHQRIGELVGHELAELALSENAKIVDAAQELFQTESQQVQSNWVGDDESGKIH